MDSNIKEVTIYVRLLDEGTDVSRPTRAVELGNGRYQLLPTLDYDADLETWEFSPGSIVGVETIKDGEGAYLRAIKLIA